MGSAVLSPRFVVYQGPAFVTYSDYVEALMAPHWRLDRTGYPLVSLSRRHASESILWNILTRKHTRWSADPPKNHVRFTESEYSFSWLV